MKRSRITIKDIAQRAQVTPTTVSLVLNHRPGISSQTREKVLKIAKELNYQPDFIAKSLRNKKSFTLGLIIKNIADPFYPEMAKGISDTAVDLGYNVILCNVGDDADLKVRYLNDLRNKGVDGVIITTLMNDDPYIRPLLEESFPFVATVRTVTDPDLAEKIDSVTVDNFAGGYQAVAHLCGLGHRRIGLITGLSKTSTAAHRTAGAKKALQDHGLRINPKLIMDCGFSRDRAVKGARRLLAMKNPPTAIFAQDDNMALGVREVVLGAGRRIPEDLALVGFDDIDMASLTGIELTTVNQKIGEMGALSAKVLVDKIEKKDTPLVNKIVLQPEMIVRKSCGAYLKKNQIER